MPDMRLAIAQLKSNLYDKETNIYRIAQTVEEARKKQNADFVLFPELFLTGYTLNEKVRDLAESVNGQSISRIRKIDRKSVV